MNNKSSIFARFIYAFFYPPRCLNYRLLTSFLYENVKLLSVLVICYEKQEKIHIVHPENSEVKLNILSRLGPKLVKNKQTQHCFGFVSISGEVRSLTLPWTPKIPESGPGPLVNLPTTLFIGFYTPIYPGYCVLLVKASWTHFHNHKTFSNMRLKV